VTKITNSIAASRRLESSSTSDGSSLAPSQARRPFTYVGRSASHVDLLEVDPALANSGNSIPVGFLEPEALSLKPFPHYYVIMQQNPTQVATDNATTLAIGDFNGDGKLDLVGTSLYCYRQTRPLAQPEWLSLPCSTVTCG